MALFARLCRLFQRANVNGRETREGRKDANLPPESNEGRRRWTWRMWMAHRQTTSSVPVTSKKQFEKEEKELIKKIQLTTKETNELRDRLIYVTEGSMNKRPYHRQTRHYKELKLKEKEIMTYLHNLEMENMEARENKQEFKKEKNFYRNLHTRILLEENLIKKKLAILQQESKEIHADWAIIQERLVELNLSCKDEQEKTSNLETQENQVSEAARELGLATAEEDSILQNELPCQEAPAEHHTQNPPSSSDESSSDESSYSTCPAWE
ncbi:spermatogenesis associated glutamate (E)-rich protein 4a [Mus musculus]|uniref:Spermatogenesis associated glutamate (E)-rich protein 4A1 n=1 Tax=Mus musculus TaxID=10090 RepID=F8VPX6_MOUSE|nr:spermatogenesis associated glutamate (E)-rich protein 4a [Mus musculus]AAI68410.1 Spermatogenesis associated glutamate (E)-rich protein 4a [synthetic construct]|eukprot:NP_083652.2 spermatogenesis associated glutamate (E)-rich protein 4a [Mus musculus]